MLGPKTMKWVRRIHMYTGIALVPWVFLYGVTAFLFNHPSAFSDTQQVSEAIPEDLATSESAEELASRVLAELQSREPDAEWTLSTDDTSEFETVFVRGSAGDQKFDAWYRPDGDHLTVRTRLKPAEPESRRESEFLGRDDESHPPLESLATPVFASYFDAEPEGVQVRRDVRVTIPLTRGEDAEAWTATYFLDRDRLDLEPSSPPPTSRASSHASTCFTDIRASSERAGSGPSSSTAWRA